MRKVLFSILTIAIVGIMCIGCQSQKGPDSNSDFDEPGVAEVNRALLYGEWQISKAKYAKDATMTEWDHESTYFTFNENGIYEGEGYYGKVNGIYTIQGNVIKVLIDNVTYAEYKVLAQAEDALTLCAKFTSTSTPVWMECGRPEYLELPEQGTISVDTMFQKESDFQAYTSNLYLSVAKYLNAQLTVELYIYNGERNKLTPSSGEVSNLWSAGYSVIHQANSLIKAVNGFNPSNYGFDLNQYLIHARTLRDFVIYNMNHLWGGIPLVTEDTTVEQASTLSRTSETMVNDYIVNDLLNVGNFPEHRWEPARYMVSERVISMLMAECYLAKGDKQSAKSKAEFAYSGDEGEFFILWLSNSNTQDGRIGLPVYTKSKADLYLKESKNQTDGLDIAWENSFCYTYGYWATLKRLGIAMEKVHCEEYLLLLPIPEREIISNPKITQNPGY